MAQCQCGEIRGPVCGAVLAPYVKLKARGGASEITVGNLSAPGDKNHAIIKSFQYGHDDGVGATVEIFDEAGGDFLNFAKSVFKDASKTPDQAAIATIEWGWIITDCNNQTTPFFTKKPHSFIIYQVDINYATGSSASGFIFRLELINLIDVNFDTRLIETIGQNTGGQSVEIKNAIREICKKAKPPINNVKFVKAPQGGGAGGGGCDFLKVNCQGQGEIRVIKGQGEFEFANNPKWSWSGAGNNLLEVLREWIKNFRTKDGKGVIILWDETADGGTLVFQESNIPACGFTDKDTKFNLPSIGTYVVNGGNISPVISFNPQIKWPFAMLDQSGAAIHPERPMTDKESGVQGAAPLCKDDENADRKNVGANVRAAVNEAAQENGVSGKQGAAAQTIHSRSSLLIQTPIEAELTIQGDPRLDEPLMLKTHSCGIVFINPFNVTSAAVGGDCDWQQLAGSPCNDCLSNSEWIIKSVAHSIREGGYSTTLKIYLPHPCPN